MNKMKTKSGLSYSTYGSGPPLLFLHGGPGLGLSYFFPNMRKLESSCQTIFFDQRGCGDSSNTKLDEDNLLEQAVLDIESLREELKFDTWSLCGHSWGGFLLSHYALRFPERIIDILSSLKEGDS